MPVYTRRFGAATGLAAGNHQFFTATDLWVWILRDLVVSNDSTAPEEVAVFIRAGTAAFFILREQTLAPSSTARFDGRQEILPDEILELYSTGPNTSVIATGYALTPVTG